MKDGIIKGDGTSRFIKATLPDTYEAFKAACASGAQPLDILMNLAGWDVVPDFLNKENLLQDETETALFGSAANRTVDGAFRGIAFKFKAISDGLATIKVTITDEGGKPVSGVMLTNVQSDAGGIVLSDASGVVNGYIAEGPANVAVSGYGDLEDAAVPTFTAVAGGSYTKTLTVKRRTFLDIQASKTFWFSGDVSTVDVSLVDGGDSGGWGNYRENTDIHYGQAFSAKAISGRGGDAGKTNRKLGLVPVVGMEYPAIVGSGGTDGNPGGKTSFMGVSGSNKNGIGGAAGTATKTSHQPGGVGTSGTRNIFSSFLDETPVGGGGGAGQANYYEDPYSHRAEATAGGPPGGGHGSDTNDTKDKSGADGLGGGGGGAAVKMDVFSGGSPLAIIKVTSPGRGGNGRVTARIHLK